MKLHLTLLRSVPPPSARCTTRTPPHALIAQRATLYTQKGDGTRVSRRQAEPASHFSLPLPCLPMVPHSLDSQPVTTHKPHNPTFREELLRVRRYTLLEARSLTRSWL